MEKYIFHTSKEKVEEKKLNVIIAHSDDIQGQCNVGKCEYNRRISSTKQKTQTHHVLEHNHLCRMISRCIGCIRLIRHRRWFSLSLTFFIYTKTCVQERNCINNIYSTEPKKNQHQPKCGEYTHSKKGEENVRNKHFIAERRRHALVNEIVLLFCLPDELLASCTQFTLFHASFCTN